LIRIHLPPDELSVLQTTFRTTSDRRLRDRAQIIMMAHRGRPHQAIAEDLSINRRGVQRWLHAYLERGLEGLQPRHAKGKPRPEQRYPGITAALEALLSDELALAGSPEGDQKWVRSSAKNLSQRLRELGFDVGRHAVLALLKRMGFSLRMNVRKRKGLCGDPARREEQFRYMASQRKAFREAGQPMISVDTKKKELIGNFRNKGRAWCRKAPEVDEYDFASQAECVAVPYGIYDMTRNTGYVVVGLSHNTPEFAVSTIARWWQEEGRLTHAGANKLLIFADGGGGNGSRARAWKFNLQEKLCDPFHLTVTVCHYPPGCSKSALSR
jgi:transposase